MNCKKTDCLLNSIFSHSKITIQIYYFFIIHFLCISRSSILLSSLLFFALTSSLSSSIYFFNIEICSKIFCSFTLSNSLQSLFFLLRFFRSKSYCNLWLLNETFKQESMPETICDSAKIFAISDLTPTYKYLFLIILSFHFPNFSLIKVWNFVLSRELPETFYHIRQVT